MASKEAAIEPLNYQTWVLKVPIHCEGCKKKVKKILSNVNGVHSVDIDSQQNKVSVTGDVDADTLIRRLAKSGKHADMWPEKKPANPNLSPTSNPKAEDKVKESEAAQEKKKKKKKSRLPAADEVTAADKPPAGSASEPETKPVEKSKISADTEASKREKEQADTGSETDTSTAKATGSGKRNEKKQGESASTSSEALAMEGHSGIFPHDRPYPTYQAPVHQHPAYAVSHSTAHPMASHSYFYAQVPPVPHTHLGHPYSGYNYNHPPVPPQHSEYYPPGSYNHYNWDDHHYGWSSMESTASQSHSYSYYDSQKPLQSYSYYDSTEPRASPSHSYSTQGGLDMFSDENANGCNVM